MRKLTIAEFVANARKVHGEKYDYSKVKYVNGSSKVAIVCPVHGVFFQKPNNHNHGFGCFRCGGKAKPTNLEFRTRACAVHGSRYTYENVNYVNNWKRVSITCREHGSFLQAPSVHLAGHGCSRCAGKISANRLTLADFVSRATKVHKGIYSYNLVAEYRNNQTVVPILCKTHGVFEQLPGNHLNGAGCPSCANNKTLTTSVFIERALIVHAGLYDYSLTVYGRNNASKVKIVCPVHGVFLQRPANHLNGAGCLSCMNSRGEVAIYKWLKAHFLEFEQQKHFVDCINPHDRSRRGRLKFDFYIVSSNLLIEYDGEQHFGLSLLRGVHRQTEDELQENQLRDDIKTQYAHSKGITLLRINFKQFSLITKLLTDALLGTGLIKEDKEAIGTI